MADIVYNKSQILITDPGFGKIVIYPRLSDKMFFDIDLKNLKSYIVGRDLVFETYAGGRIVISNYALLFAENNDIEIIDSNNNSYKLDNFIDNTLANLIPTSDDLILIDRRLSSSETRVEGDSYPSSSKNILDSSFQESLLTGTVNVDDQSVVSDTKTEVNPYDIKILKYETDKKYDVDIIFSYNGTTFLNGSDDFYNPIKVANGAISLEGLYGSTYAVNSQMSDFTNSKDNNLIFLNGGGIVPGFSISPDSTEQNIYYGFDSMWRNQKINLPSLLGDGSFNVGLVSSPTIRRAMQVQLEGSNVRLTSVDVSGVPIGIVLKSDSKTSVTGGAGFYKITSKQQTAVLNLNFEYNKDFLTRYGVDENLFQLTLTVKGYNVLTKSLVESEQVFFLHFKDVKSTNDILNFEFNTFTFSTSIDPLEIIFGGKDDYAVGGAANHTYRMGAGNDTFISGSGDEVVYLEEGDDFFYVGLGNDKVFGGTGFDTVMFLDTVNFTNARVTLENGVISVVNDKYTTILEEFESIILAANIKTFVVKNTENLGDSFYAYANGSGKTIDVSQAKQGLYINTLLGYLTASRDISLNKLFFMEKENEETRINNKFDTILASNFNDTFIAGADSSLNIIKNSGAILLDYSNLVLRSGLLFNYNPSNGGVSITKDGFTDNIKLSNNPLDLNTIIGTGSNDTYIMDDKIGSFNINSLSVSSTGGNLVDYSALSSGISTVYENFGSSIFVSKGNNLLNTDFLSGIDEVKYTKYDDTLVFNSFFETSIDGGGYIDRDTANFSNIRVGALRFEISGNFSNVNVLDAEGSITATKMTFTGFNSFVGTSNIDQFILVGDISNIKNLYINGGSSGSNILKFQLDKDKTNITNIDFSKLSQGFATINYESVIDNNIQGLLVARNISKYILTTSGSSVTVESFNDTSLLNQEVEASIIGTDFVLGDLSTRGNKLVVTNGTPDNTLIFSKYSNLSNFNSVVLDGVNFKTGIDITMDQSLNDITNSGSGGENKFRHFFANTPKGNIVNAIKSTSIDYNGISSSYNLGGFKGVASIDSSIFYIANDDSSGYYFRNFNSFTGSSRKDVFNVGLTEFSLIIDGIGGGDDLKYDQIAEDLVFDLTSPSNSFSVYRDVSSTNYLQAQRIDKVYNITNIYGSSGSNYFILALSASVADIQYNIIGSNAVTAKNIISYQDSAVAYDSDKNNATASNNFQNINGFEYTKFNDNININFDEAVMPKFLKGYTGYDQIIPINIGTKGDTLVYNIENTNDDTLVRLLKAGSDIKSLNVSGFEVFRGFNGVNTTFNINTFVNSSATDVEKNLYIIGADSTSSFNVSNIVDYSKIDPSKTLEITIDSSDALSKHSFKTDRNLVAKERNDTYNFSIRVDKKEGATTYTDYLGNIDTIKLNSGNNKLNIIINLLENSEIRSIKSIDFGTQGTVSFLKSNSGIFFNQHAGIYSINNSPSAEKFDIVFDGWTALELTTKDDSIVLSQDFYNKVKNNSTVDYFINGVSGSNSIDYGNITLDAGSHLSINFSSLDTSGSTKIVQANVVNSATSVIDFALNSLQAFNKITGSLSDNTFYLNLRQSYELFSSNSTTSVTTLDYSEANLGSQLNGFVFNISDKAGLDNIVIEKNIIDGFIDIVKNYGNITSFVGSKNNDLFKINSFLKKLSIDGHKGFNTLDLSGAAGSLTTGTTNGVYINLSTGVLAEYAGLSPSFSPIVGSSLATIKNFQNITGTLNSDYFVVGESFFSTEGSVVSGGSNSSSGIKNILQIESAVGSQFIINTNINQITKLAALSKDELFLKFSNIKELYLGDGDHTLILGGSELTKIQGGSGTNSISLLQSTKGVVNSFIDNINFGGSSTATQVFNFNDFTLTNFDDDIKVRSTDTTSYKVDAVQVAFTTNKLRYTDLFDNISIELASDNINNRVATVDRKDSNNNSQKDIMKAFDTFDFETKGSKIASFNIKDIKNFYNINNANIVSYQNLFTAPQLGRIVVDFTDNSVIKAYKYISSSNQYFLQNIDNINNSSLTAFTGSDQDDVYKIANTSKSSININLVGSQKVIDASVLSAGAGVTFTQNASSGLAGFVIKEDVALTTNKTTYSFTNLSSSDKDALVSSIKGTAYNDTFIFNNLNFANKISLQGNSGINTLDLTNFNMNDASGSIKIDVESLVASFNTSTISNNKELFFSSTFTSFKGSNSHRNLFTGLNSSQSYTIVGSLTQINAVQYNNVIQGVIFNINSKTDVSIIKSNTSGFADILTNINNYIGSSYRDTFNLSFAVLFSDFGSATSNPYIFDGGAGNDILNLKDYTGTATQQISFQASVDINGNIKWELKKQDGSFFNIKLESIEEVNLSDITALYATNTKDHSLSLNIATLSANSTIVLKGTVNQRNEISILPSLSSSVKLYIDIDNINTTNSQQLYLINSTGSVSTLVNISGFNSYLLNQSTGNTLDNSFVTTVVNNADFNKFSKYSEYIVNASRDNLLANRNATIIFNQVSGLERIDLIDATSLLPFYKAENVTLYASAASLLPFKPVGFNTFNFNFANNSTPVEFNLTLGKTASQNSWNIFFNKAVNINLAAVPNLTSTPDARLDYSTLVIDGFNITAKDSKGGDYIKISTNDMKNSSLNLDFATASAQADYPGSNISAFTPDKNNEISIVSNSIIDLPNKISFPNFFGQTAGNNTLNFSKYLASSGEILSIKYINSASAGLDKYQATLSFNKQVVELNRVFKYILTNKVDRVNADWANPIFVDGGEGEDIIKVSYFKTRQEEAERVGATNIFRQNAINDLLKFTKTVLINFDLSPGRNDIGTRFIDNNIKNPFTAALGVSPLNTSSSHSAYLFFDVFSSQNISNSISNFTPIPIGSVPANNTPVPLGILGTGTQAGLRFKNFSVLDYSDAGAYNVTRSVIINTVNTNITSFKSVLETVDINTPTTINKEDFRSSMTFILGYGGVEFTKIFAPLHASFDWFLNNRATDNKIPGWLYNENAISLTVNDANKYIQNQNNLVFYNKFDNTIDATTSLPKGLSSDSITSTNLKLSLVSDVVLPNSANYSSVSVARSGLQVDGFYTLNNKNNQSLSFFATNINNISTGNYSKDSISITATDEMQVLSFASLSRKGVFTTGFLSNNTANTVANLNLYWLRPNKINLGGASLDINYNSSLNLSSFKVPEIAKYTTKGVADQFLYKGDFFAFGLTKKNLQYMPVQDDLGKGLNYFRLSIPGLAKTIEADRAAYYSNLFFFEGAISKVILPLGNIFTSVAPFYNFYASALDPAANKIIDKNSTLYLSNFGSTATLDHNKILNIDISIENSLNVNINLMVLLAAKYYRADSVDIGGEVYSLDDSRVNADYETNYIPTRYLFQDSLGETSMYVGRKPNALTGTYQDDFYTATYKNASVIILGVTRADVDNSEYNNFNDTHDLDYYVKVGSIVAKSNGVASRDKLGDVFSSNKVSIITNLKNDGSERALWKDILGTSTQTDASIKDINSALGARDTIDYSGIKNGRYLFTPSYQTKVTQVGLPWMAPSEFWTKQPTDTNFNALEVNYLNKAGITGKLTAAQVGGNLYSNGNLLNSDNKPNGFWGLYLSDVINSYTTAGSKYLSNNIVFSSLESRPSVELGTNMTDGYSSKTSLYYRNIGFERIIGTDADDTYVTGRAYWSSYTTVDLAKDVVSTAGIKIDIILHPSYLSDNNKATRLLEFDGVGGNNTVIHNTFSSSTRIPLNALTTSVANIDNLFPFINNIYLGLADNSFDFAFKTLLWTGASTNYSSRATYQPNAMIASAVSTGYNVNADVFGTGFSTIAFANGFSGIPAFTATPLVNYNVLGLALTQTNLAAIGTNLTSTVGFNGVVSYKNIKKFIVDDYVVEGDNTTYEKIAIETNWGIVIPDSNPALSSHSSTSFNYFQTMATGTPGGYTLPTQKPVYYTGSKNLVDGLNSVATPSLQYSVGYIPNINIEIDLGGRFFTKMTKYGANTTNTGQYVEDSTDQAVGKNTFYKETIVLPNLSLSATSLIKHNLFWISDTNPKVDTAMILLTSPTGSSDTVSVPSPNASGQSFSSSMIFKNFDNIALPGKQHFYLNFNSNLNFDVLQGKLVNFQYEDTNYMDPNASVTNANNPGLSIRYNDKLNFTVESYVVRKNSTSQVTYYFFKEKNVPNSRVFVIQAWNIVANKPQAFNTTQTFVATDIVNQVLNSYSSPIDSLNNYYMSTNYYGSTVNNLLKEKNIYETSVFDDEYVPALETISQDNIVDNSSILGTAGSLAQDTFVKIVDDYIIIEEEDIEEQNQKDDSDELALDVSNTIYLDEAIEDELAINNLEDIESLNISLEEVNEFDSLATLSGGSLLEGFDVFANEIDNSDIASVFNNLDSSTNSFADNTTSNIDFVNVSPEAIIETNIAEEAESISFALDSNTSITDDSIVVAVDNAKNKNNTNNS
jgi:hypothetical protein